MRVAAFIVLGFGLVAEFLGTPAHAGAGACCDPGGCTDVADEAACVAIGGVFLPGAACVDAPCADGACCFDTSCAISDAYSCIAGGREFAGAGTSCLDDPCDAGIGACCLGAVCDDLSPEACATAGGTWLGAGTSCVTDPCASGACCLADRCSATRRFECDAKAGTFFVGAECADDPCARPSACPPGTLYGQSLDGPDDFIAGTSEATSIFQRWDDFSGVDGPVSSITWWGFDLRLEGAVFVECVESDPTFSISFHRDAGGVPGAVECSYTVEATRTPTGAIYLGAELNRYDVTLPESCVLVNGWISIVGRGDAACWFLWISAGPGGSYCDGCLPSEQGFDLAFCLQGTSGGVFGACCTSATAICTDGVEITACTSPGQRFEPDATCDELEPACGIVLGACCFADATCERVEQERCFAAGGNWLGGDTECDQCPCITPCPPGGDAEGEPVCLPGTIDDFNGGCLSAPPVFSPLTVGTTVCGTSGVYDLDGEKTADFDWYEIDLERPAEITITVQAEFRAQVLLADGATGCPGRLVASGTGLECDVVTLTATAGVGPSWIVVYPFAFTDTAACGTRYTLTTSAAVDTCPADLDDDGSVGFTDLLAVLSQWGPCAGCDEDLDDSGDVGFTDLLLLLASWGACL
ncbi:MAG: hypothetical protein HKO59_11980 [Phycisphaerales bacterium]|nr:hypothetical protein [Phycisphaerales bacterium]